MEVYCNNSGEKIIATKLFLICDNNQSMSLIIFKNEICICNNFYIFM